MRRATDQLKLDAKTTSKHLDCLLQLAEDGVELLSQRLTTMHDQDVIAAVKLAYEVADVYNTHLSEIKAKNPNITVEDLGISTQLLESNFANVD
jgi:hypothetical protein